MKRINHRIKKINTIPLCVRRGDPHLVGQIAAMRGWAMHARTDIKIPAL
ncbi:MAG: hypothetical protein FWG80_02375 [Alphaproteobacteria bacterium]|nr:hypothetical protein [Alphaproteobacteria bacterium]